jgi:hypothetical protein
MNRGRRDEEIFNDKRDYQMFVDLLKEASEITNRGMLQSSYPVI